jgi:hypothetical protein
MQYAADALAVVKTIVAAPGPYGRANSNMLLGELAGEER